MWKVVLFQILENESHHVGVLNFNGHAGNENNEEEEDDEEQQQQQQQQQQPCRRQKTRETTETITRE